MNMNDKVAVCSRSFSKNQILRSELLSKYKNVTFNESGLQLEGDQLIAFLRGHKKAIVGLEIISKNILDSLPDLEVIAKYGVGLDMIDLPSLKHSGKKLGWIGGVNKRSVSELVIGLLINLLRNLPIANKEVIDGGWRQLVGGLLSGRVVGIIGCGHIGKDLIRLLQPWGCKILVNDIQCFPEFYLEHNVIPVELGELLRTSDIVSLHIPLNDETRNIIGTHEFEMMKSNAILINTARGGLVDELALKSALINGRIAAAAFDVFDVEPPLDQLLLKLPNFFATPHLGGSAEEAILAMGRAAIESLDNANYSI